MGYEAERNAIYSEFVTQWGNTTPIQTENRPFDPPDEGPWVSLTILRGQSDANGIQGGGKLRYRHPGVLQIDVVIQPGQGTKVATDLVDQIAAIFRGKRISGIIFKGPEVTRINEPETSRLRFICSFPFYRDEIFQT